MKCNITKNIQARVQIQNERSINVMVYSMQFDQDHYTNSRILSVSGSVISSKNCPDPCRQQTMLTLKYPKTNWNSLVFIEDMLYNGVLDKINFEHSFSECPLLDMSLYVTEVFDIPNLQQLHGLQYV